MSVTRILFAYLIGFTFSFYSARAFAQPYSMKALIDRAMSRNQELRALTSEVSASKAREWQQGRMEDPSLSLGFGNKHEPIGNTNSVEFEISQVVPRPGLLHLKEERAQQETSLQSLEREISEVELKGNVLERIYLYHVAEEKALHAKERVERFRKVETYLKSRPFAAPQKRAEAVIVRSKLLVLQKGLRELQSKRKTAWNDLNLFLGLDSEPDLITLWYQNVQEINLDELSLKARASNPVLRRRLLQVLGQESEQKLARANAWTGFTLSLLHSSGFGASPETNYGLGISSTLPLFNANDGEIRAVSALRSAAEARLVWQREKLGFELASAFEAYRAAAENLKDLAPKKIVALENEMRDIDKSFERGQVDLLTFLEADAQHVESLNAILDAQVEFVSHLRELLLLVGEAPVPLEI